MAEVHLADIELVRQAAAEPGAQVIVADIELMRVPPVGEGPQVVITDIFLTHGFEVPNSPGAIRRRVSGAWQGYPTQKVRWNGVWA